MFKSVFFIMIYAIGAIACYRVSIDAVNTVDAVINGVVGVVLLLMMMWTGMSRSFKTLDEMINKIRRK